MELQIEWSNSSRNVLSSVARRETRGNLGLKFAEQISRQDGHNREKELCDRIGLPRSAVALCRQAHVLRLFEDWSGSTLTSVLREEPWKWKTGRVSPAELPRCDGGIFAGSASWAMAI